MTDDELLAETAYKLRLIAAIDLTTRRRIADGLWPAEGAALIGQERQQILKRIRRHGLHVVRDVDD